MGKGGERKIPCIKLVSQSRREKISADQIFYGGHWNLAKSTLTNLSSQGSCGSVHW